jgi:hypothetical protein
MLRLTLLSAFLLALAPASAQAQRWQEIGKTSTGNSVYLDPRSVSRAPDGIITATVRVVYTTPVDTPQGPITGSRSIAMFNCTAKKVAVKENIIWHDEARGTMYRKSNPAQPGFGPALTSTFAHVAMEHLCSAR